MKIILGLKDGKWIIWMEQLFKKLNAVNIKLSRSIVKMERFIFFAIFPLHIDILQAIAYNICTE